MTNFKDKHGWLYLPFRWLRRLYDWVTHWAQTRFAVPALFLLAVAESSFFPIPPDVLLIALGFGQPKRSFYYALICSVGSVLGGVIGYLIGYYLWHLVSGFFTTYVFSPELFAAVQNKYELYSFWVIFAAAFTPIPYKIFTIAGGVFAINFPGFVLASIVGRSMRFFMVAATVYFCGEKAKPFIEKYFEWVAIGFTVLLVGGFVVVKKIL